MKHLAFHRPYVRPAQSGCRVEALRDSYYVRSGFLDGYGFKLAVTPGATNGWSRDGNVLISATWTTYSLRLAAGKRSDIDSWCLWPV